MSEFMIMDELLETMLRGIRFNNLSQDEVQRINNIPLETLEKLNDYCSDIIAIKQDRVRKLGGFREGDISYWWSDNIFKSRCMELSEGYKRQTSLEYYYFKRRQLVAEIERLISAMTMEPNNQMLKQEYRNKFRKLAEYQQHIHSKENRLVSPTVVSSPARPPRTILELKTRAVELREEPNENYVIFEKPILFYDIEDYTTAKEFLQKKILQARRIIEQEEQHRLEVILRAQKLEEAKRQAEAKRRAKVQRWAASLVEEILETVDQHLVNLELQRQAEAEQRAALMNTGDADHAPKRRGGERIPALGNGAPAAVAVPAAGAVAIDEIVGEEAAVEQVVGNKPPLVIAQNDEIYIEAVKKAKIAYPSLGKKKGIAEKTLDKIETIKAKKDTLAEDTKKYKSLSNRIKKLQDKIANMSQAKFGTILQRRRARKMLTGNTIF